MLWRSDEAIESLALNQQEVFAAFIVQDRLYLADLQQRQIWDLCFVVENVRFRTQLVWSPSGEQLAFTYNGYLTLLTLETLTAQFLDYPTGSVVGWYPLAD